MKISYENSQKIKNMSLFCAALVVSIHVGIPIRITKLSWFIQEFFIEGIAQIAVPFFIIVSGFFLATHINEYGWWKYEVKKRFFSIVIPFYIWSLLWVLNLELSVIIENLIIHHSLGTNSLVFIRNFNWMCILGIDLTNYPIAFPLWYLRCLFFLIILSPIVSLFTLKFKFGWLFLCFVIMFIYTHIPYPVCKSILKQFGFRIGVLFYFSVGIFIEQHRNFKSSQKTAIISTVIGILLLITRIICLYNHLNFQNILGRVSVPFLLYAIWHFTTTKRLHTWLVRSSFPIFLMHMFFQPYVDFVLRHIHIAERNLFLQTMFYFLNFNFLVGFIGPIIVANLLYCFMPKLSRILFGGR